MQVMLATKTLALINEAIEKDQGNTFRGILGKIIMQFRDPFRDDEDGFRTHLGASMIGRECARELWYNFHWVRKSFFSGKMLRLFNRGHLEEPRLIAALMAAGITIYQQDADGKQFRITGHGGHFGGSGDGVAVGIPDLMPGTPALIEAKTHNDDSFKKLAKGVRHAKFEHYVQMCLYMEDMKLSFALYLGVNKNNDEIHAEIVAADQAIARQFKDRAGKIIFSETAPAKLPNSSPGFFKCQFCDYKSECHLQTPFIKNCRTCQYLSVDPEGGMHCQKHQKSLTKEEQIAGCDNYVAIVNNGT
jgi:hypothetical protein